MPNVSSVITGFFPTAVEGFTTTLASTISAGATTVPLNSVSGFSNGQYVVLVIEPTSATKKQAFTGVVDTSGVQITGVKWTEGSNDPHTAGVTVVDYETATHWALYSRGIGQEHNPDGTHGAVTATSVTASGTVQGATVVSTGDIQHRSVSLETINSEYEYDFVASGLVWSGDSYGSTRAASMTAGVVYINGKRVAVSSVSARTFTASKDTYIDVDNTGTITYTEATNNAASPALSANNIRIGIIVTAAGSIASVASINQGEIGKLVPIASSVPYMVTDSLGNKICNRDPRMVLLGYKHVTASQTGVTAEADATGLAAPVIVPTGRSVKITSNTIFDVSNADTYPHAAIKESTTYLGGKSGQTGTGAIGFRSLPIETVITPTAGAHTYKIAFQRSAGTGTVSLVAAAAAANTNGPAFIKVELV